MNACPGSYAGWIQVHTRVRYRTTLPISLKILASHLGVGAIIAGSSIEEIKHASDARIQIPGDNEV
jgi:hypothetical protein